MRPAALLLLIVGMASAVVIGPRVYEQDDIGDPMFQEFTYSLAVDCTAATIDVMVMNESVKPVAGAGTYLKYVDFSSPVISNVATDRDGHALHKLPGNVRLMRGMFILVMEKKGFRSKEVHFDITGCLTNESWIPPPPPPKPPPTGQNTNWTWNDAGDADDGGADGTEAGAQGNSSVEPAGPDSEAPAAGGLCVAALILPLLMFFKAING